MSKLTNYMVLAVTLTFLLKFAGIPSGADAFMTWLGLNMNPSGVSLGAFIIGISAILVAGAATSRITIGFFTSQVNPTSIISIFCNGVFIILISTFISVVNYTAGIGGWVYYLTFIFFIPLIVGFGIAMINFWRGFDL